MVSMRWQCHGRPSIVTKRSTTIYRNVGIFSFRFEYYYWRVACLDRDLRADVWQQNNFTYRRGCYNIIHYNKMIYCYYIVIKLELVFSFVFANIMCCELASHDRCRCIPKGIIYTYYYIGAQYHIRVLYIMVYAINVPGLTQSPCHARL